jgi:hypothetical protein
MKQHHRKAIVAALAAAGLLTANISYAGSNVPQQAGYEQEYMTKKSSRTRVDPSSRQQVSKKKGERKQLEQ